MAKIFFSCSMRGGFSSVSQDDLRKIVDLIESMGHTLATKHQVSKTFYWSESPLPVTYIHDRDTRFFLDSDYVIAEISNPSLGVGAEISDASWFGKPVLCLYSKEVTKSVSAYVRGMCGSKLTPNVECYCYSNHNEIKDKISEFIKSHPVKEKEIKYGAIMLNKKKELLLVRKKKTDVFITPGGQADADESNYDALKRELEEELKIKMESFDYYKSYLAENTAYDKKRSLVLHMYSVAWEGEPSPHTEIVEAKWVSKKDFISKKYKLPETLDRLFNDLIKEGIVK